MSTRLALGTVQFGLDYGIASAQGQVNASEAQRIVAEAERLGICTLDTAIDYGESETVLGRIGVASAEIVTKLPSHPPMVADIEEWMLNQMSASLDRLGLQKVHAVLLHRPNQLLEPVGAQLYAALQGLKFRGLTKKIGISIYAPEELGDLYTRFDLDIVQGPLSILDRRLVETGWANRLHQDGVELHTRSAFLQGLLLMSSKMRPPFFARWKLIWDEWEAWLGKTGLTPLEACLRYVLSVDEVDRVVVGVDSLAHLREIVSSSGGDLPSLPDWPDKLDADLLNPSLWKLT